MPVLRNRKKKSAPKSKPTVSSSDEEKIEPTASTRTRGRTKVEVVVPARRSTRSQSAVAAYVDDQAEEANSDEASSEVNSEGEPEGQDEEEEVSVKKRSKAAYKEDISSEDEFTSYQKTSNNTDQSLRADRDLEILRDSDIDKQQSSPDDGPFTRPSTSPIRSRHRNEVMVTPESPSPTKKNIRKRLASESPEADDMPITPLKMREPIKTPATLRGRKPKVQPAELSSQDDDESQDDQVLVVSKTPKSKHPPPIRDAKDNVFLVKAPKATIPTRQSRSPKKKARVQEIDADDDGNETEPVNTPVKRKVEVKLRSDKIVVEGTRPRETPSVVERRIISMTGAVPKKSSAATPVKDKVSRQARQDNTAGTSLADAKDTSSTVPLSPGTPSGMKALIQIFQSEQFRLEAEQLASLPDPNGYSVGDPKDPANIDAGLVSKLLAPSYAIAPPIYKRANVREVGGKIQTIVFEDAMKAVGIPKTDSRRGTIAAFVVLPAYGSFSMNPGRLPPNIFSLGSNKLISQVKPFDNGKVYTVNQTTMCSVGLSGDSYLLEPKVVSRNSNGDPLYLVKQLGVLLLSLECERSLAVFSHVLLKDEEVLEVKCYGDTLSFGTRVGNMGKEDKSKFRAYGRALNSSSYVVGDSPLNRLIKAAASGSLSHTDQIEVYDASEFLKTVLPKNLSYSLVTNIGAPRWLKEIPESSLVAVHYTVGSYGSGSTRTLSLNLLAVVILALPSTYQRQPDDTEPFPVKPSSSQVVPDSEEEESS